MKKIGLILGIFGVILFLIWTGLRIYLAITFDIDVGDRIKRASDANQPELAMKEMDDLLQNIEDREICNDFPRDDCYTSILYNTPDEDISFWRQNLRQAREDLFVLQERIKNGDVPPGEEHLVISNSLMKLRESLVDYGGEHPDPTVPDGISVYPHNFGFCLWSFLSLLLILVGGVMWLVEEEGKKRRR